MQDIQLNDGDLYIVNGAIRTVSEKNKLEQQVKKILLTTIGFYLHPDYGSNLIERLSHGQGSGVDGDITADIRTAMDYFIFLQKPKVQLDSYDAKEILYKVLNITIEHHDPRGAYPNITIMNAAQDTAEFSLVF